MTSPAAPDGWPRTWPYPASTDAVVAGGGMVATTDRYATEAGVEVLRAGGDAVDAAVAVTFALAVVNPEAGNVAGGGFTVIRTADGTVAALDHRSRAPAAATRDMFPASGGGPGGSSELGHLAVAVPGTVMGAWEAHRRFGTLPWSRLVEPAVELARGFRVEDRLARSFPPHIVDGLGRFPASAGIFLPGGRPPRVGDTFRQPDLAGALERIRDLGPDGFYRGETAERILAEVGRGGGVLTAEDLASYEAVWREPVRFRYRGRTVVSMPPPSSGGVTLAEIAHMLADVPLGELPWHGPRHVHLLAETFRRAFADRNRHLADPDFARMPLETLTSRAYARWRASDIASDRATPSSDVAAGVEARRWGPHTTHVSVVDGRGNAVSLTTTLNTWYGSKVVAPGTGILLNNEMDDFAVRPGEPNHFGLVQGDINAIEPGKRPLSAMTPAIVLDEDGGLSMVVGTPGGATIITTVFQVLSNVLDHGMDLGAAVAAPRVHHQHLPDRIDHEPGGLDAGVVEALQAMGHEVRARDEPYGDVQAIAVRPDGALEGRADPRRGGVAVGL